MPILELNCGRKMYGVYGKHFYQSLTKVKCDRCGEEKIMNHQKHWELGNPFICKRCKLLHPLSDYYKLAEENKFKIFLSDNLPNAHDNILWICENGHKWEADFSRVKRGRGCPHCNGYSHKTIEDYKNLAKERGIEFLDTKIKGVKDKHKWKCKCGNIWMARWRTVKTSYCRKCGVKNFTGEKHFLWVKDREFQEAKIKMTKQLGKLIKRCIFNKKSERSQKILGYTPLQLKERLESTWEPWMNWGNYGSIKNHTQENPTWQIDHIKPIAQFMKENIFDPRIINDLNNLQALDSLENDIKGNRYSE